MKNIKSKLPKIIKSLGEHRSLDKFPLKYYSYSSMKAFTVNPVMFRINYINGDRVDTRTAASALVGKAFHVAMERYYDAVSEDRIKDALTAGMEYISEYADAWIEWGATVPNKQKAQELLAFAIQTYVNKKESDTSEVVSIEEMIEEQINVEWKGQQIALPIPLKGYVDKIVRDDQGRLKVVDYKTARSFSDPEKIDGGKILQAIVYFFLVYAKYGEAPYSMIFEEVKLSKSKDGEQIKEYEVVYEQNDLFFDFFFRLYQDITDAINGKAVFVPNIAAIFDNEVAMIAYIYRLDVSEEQSAIMKKLKVDNITDLLKQKIEHAGNMRQLLKTAEKKFVSAQSLNYHNMQVQERIQTKLMEHGMLVKFDSIVEGYAIDLYRYTPSIGLKMKKLESYVADIEQVVGKSGVRVLAPIPNSSFVGFEVPRAERRWADHKPELDGFNLTIGMDVYGEVYKFDVRQAPHMLVAGATGSGKSVFLNSIIDQLSRLAEVELHLFDPKMVELAQFQSQAVEYQTDIEGIYLALDDLKNEMNYRYELMAKAGVRNIDGMSGKFNYKFVVIDEFGDLVLSGAKDGKVNLSKQIQESILILAQKARAAGIHLILATQRPSVDIITGTIKANFPTKAAFRMAKAIDSTVLLDQAGAEKLLGKGDMLFSSDAGVVRLQGLNN